MKKEISDIEAVILLASHIENPCEVKVQGKKENIRYFYINLSEKILPTLKNPYAKEYLKRIILKYNQ